MFIRIEKYAKKTFTQCKVNVLTEYLNKVMTLSGAFDQRFITNGICSATITPEFTNDVAPFQFQPCYTKDDNFRKKNQLLGSKLLQHVWQVIF